MILSIIVPVYNVEKYIAKCLYSLLDQDLNKADYEIVVVNDGSPDGSADVARKIAQQHDNIRVIDKVNGGLSSARNMGLESAKGEYVVFIDSDDYIKSNVLGGVIDKCESNNLDILSYKFEWVDENYETIKHNYFPRVSICDKVMSGRDALISGNFLVMVCMFIYRREWLVSNDMRFMAVGHEDEEFTPRALFFCRRFMMIDTVVYSYLQRSTSYTQQLPVKSCFDITLVCESLCKFHKKHIKNDSVLTKLFCKNIRVLLQVAIERANNVETKEELCAIIYNKAILRPLYFWSLTKHYIPSVKISLLERIKYIIKYYLKFK